jgi:dTDP-4-dehydrorhamnose reductase
VTLLVIGGSGYLGGELLTRAPWAAAPSSSELDIRDEAAVFDFFMRTGPRAVVNAAYRRDDRATTCDGAIHVARAATVVGARFVHVSTDLVFDGEKGSPYVEEDEPAPVNDYGRDKADAELEVLDACPGAAVVRTSLIYGGPSPGPQERMAADPGAAFFTDEYRCPVQVGDLAAALLELASSGHEGLLHVAGADRVSRRDFAELLSKGPVRATSQAEAGEPRPRDCSLSIERARGLLRTPLRGVREVLKAP